MNDQVVASRAVCVPSHASSHAGSRRGVANPWGACSPIPAAAARLSFSVAPSISSTTRPGPCAAAARSRPRGSRHAGLSPDDSAARTCLHGPRSPRWRANHGQVQRAPSGPKRTRYSTSPLETSASSPTRRTPPAVDQLPRAEEPRVHPLQRRPVVGQLAVEEGARREVVPDAARRAKRAERPLHLRPRDAEALGGRGCVDRRLAVEVVGDGLDHVLVAPRGRRGRRLAGEAAVELGADGEARTRAAVEQRAPTRSARAPRARLAVRRRPVDAQPAREREQPLEQPQPLGPGEADRPSSGREASRSALPAGAATRPRASACAAGSAGTGALDRGQLVAEHHRDAATCTSAKPFTQRVGSGTFRSTAEPPSVVTTTSSWPTCISIASASRTPASAAASAG